jgi:hypothetical protein
VRAPLLAYVAVASQAAPLFAAAAWRRHGSGARRWVLAWCALLLVVDCVSGWLGSRGVHNIFLFNLVAPASVAVVLWALSRWQTGDLSRLTMRLAIVPFLLLWTVLTLAVDDSSTFSRAANPMANIVGLGAAAFTLLARSFALQGDLPRRDWFWVTGGMALYFGASSALGPLSALLIATAPQLLGPAYELKAGLDIVAFLLIARGVVCPTET